MEFPVRLNLTRKYLLAEAKAFFISLFHSPPPPPPALYLSIYLYFSHSLFLYLSYSLFLSLFISISLFLSLYLSLSLYIYTYISLSLSLSQSTYIFILFIFTSHIFLPFFPSKQTISVWYISVFAFSLFPQRSLVWSKARSLKYVMRTKLISDHLLSSAQFNTMSWVRNTNG